MRHVVEGLYLRVGLRYSVCHLFYIATVDVCDNPVAEIVEARCVSIGLSLAVTE